MFPGKTQEHPSYLPLIPSPSNLSRTPTSTHTHYQHISPHRHLPHCIQAGSGNPTAQKPTLNTSLLENYRPISLLPFIAKHLNELSLTRSHCFFHRTTNWTLNSQVSGVAIQLRLRYYRSLKPCELQKPIPNHQSSFCWISLPLWHCQSSDPPVHPLITGHHWDSTSLVWILSHWSVFQGGLGRGGIQST